MDNDVIEEVTQDVTEEEGSAERQEVDIASMVIQLAEQLKVQGDNLMNIHSEFINEYRTNREVDRIEKNTQSRQSYRY